MENLSLSAKFDIKQSTRFQLEKHAASSASGANSLAYPYYVGKRPVLTALRYVFDFAMTDTGASATVKKIFYMMVIADMSAVPRCWF